MAVGNHMDEKLVYTITEAPRSGWHRQVEDVRGDPGNRLKARKLGRRTLIGKADLDASLRALPVAVITYARSRLR